MKFPLLSLLLFSLIGCCAASVKAQKKDEKNKSALVSPPPTPYSNVERDSLLNGLKLTSLERPADNSVKCNIIIRAGAMFDLAGKTGQARLAQDSLLAVNPRLKEEVESLQAKIDWGVDWDVTWFNIESPANNFDTVLEIVARLLVAENIRADAFKKAQQDLLEKIKSARPEPPEQANELFFKALYGDHPYGHNIDGSEATVAGIKQGDIYDFLRRFYIANNVSAVVVGNISHARSLRAFKVFFGGWTKGQLVPATFRPPLQVTQLKLVKVENPAFSGVELRGGVIGVKHTDPDFPVAETLARILTARLKKSFGAEPPVFTIKAEPRILPGPFYFSASVPAEKAQEISRILTEQFDSLATSTITAEELAEAKSGLSGEYAARPAEHFLREIESYHFPRDYPGKIQSRIEAISLSDAQRVSKKLREANALTILVLGKI